MATALECSRGLFVATVAATAAGCAGLSNPRCAAGLQAQVAEHLYFGQAMPDGQVSAAAWQAFLDAEVSPRFPQGFSAWPVAGQWRSASGALVREPSHVLNIVHEDSAAVRAAIGQIMQAYKLRFQQEAVLRVQTQACVAL
jgi:hypothetical protein